MAGAVSLLLRYLFIYKNANSNRASLDQQTTSPIVKDIIFCSSVRHRGDVINPASMKQALLASARRIPDANIFEQGRTIGYIC